MSTQNLDSKVSHCSNNFKTFFNWSLEYAEKHNKIIDIRNVKAIKDGKNRYSGWCDGDKIVIASKNPLFEDTFVHEFAHLTQAIEEEPTWTNVNDRLWSDLKNNTVTIKTWDSVKSLIAIEHDCESRTLKFIKRFNITDPGLYAQRANTYLYFYQLVFITGKWQSSTGIYKDEIVSIMPKKILPLKTFDLIDMNVVTLYNDILRKYRKK